MSFLDEVTYNIKPGQKVPDTVEDDDVVNIGEKKKDHDGDGDIDSDDYLIARDKAIKKAMGKKVEEGAASKFLGALGIAAALLAVGNQNKSDSVLKAIDAKIEQADNPAEKAALKKLANQRLIWLDTGKGPGGDIKASDVGAVLKELSEKSCGCGQTPCKTYGKISEDEDDTSLGIKAARGLDDFFDKLYSGNFKPLKDLINKINSNEFNDPEDKKFFEDIVNNLKDKKNPKVTFEKDSDEEKRFFKILKDLKFTSQEIKDYEDLIKAIRDKNSTNENMSKDKEKTVELPADTTFTLDLKHLMKKHMDEGKSKEDTIKFTKALMAKLHNKGEVTVDGTKIIFKEADVPQDAPLALPEPEAPDYLGADGKDYEGGMAKSQMLKMKNYAKALCDMVDDETQLEAWVQAKITKASDYMSAVYHYLDYQKSKMNEEEFKPLTKQEKDRLVDIGGLEKSELAAYEKFLKANPDLPDSMPKAIKAFKAKK